MEKDKPKASSFGRCGQRWSSKRAKIYKTHPGGKNEIIIQEDFLDNSSTRGQTGKDENGGASDHGDRDGEDGTAARLIATATYGLALILKLGRHLERRVCGKRAVER